MLGNLGLYAAPTTGNGNHTGPLHLIASLLTVLDTGNCLFISFSDQLYGNEDHHLEIRACVVEFLRENAEYFKPFTAVNLGGGERRNSRRRNASKYSTTFDFHQATENDVDLQYSLKLQRMAELGTYGDHMEIMAFSAAYGVDVKVHRAQGIAESVTPDCLVGATSTERPMAHIAYHVSRSPSFQTIDCEANTVPGPRALLFRPPSPHHPHRSLLGATHSRNHPIPRARELFFFPGHLFLRIHLSLR